MSRPDPNAHGHEHRPHGFGVADQPLTNVHSSPSTTETTARTSAHGTPPSRRHRTGRVVQSTTVDAAPPQRPPSTASAGAGGDAKDPTSSSTLVADGAPWRLALVTASGPSAAHNALSTRCPGHRRPTESPAPPTNKATAGGAGTTRVSAPGQKRPARVSALSGQAEATVLAWSMLPMMTGNATSAGRPFRANSDPTPAGVRHAARP